MVFIEDIKILGGDFNFNINVEVWAITPFTMEIHLYNLVRDVPLYGGGGVVTVGHDTVPLDHFVFF